MRLKDMLERLKYVVTNSGPNRRERRKVIAQTRATGQTPHGKARMRPQNQSRDKHKLRRLIKARRKQKLGGKAP